MRNSWVISYQLSLISYCGAERGVKIVFPGGSYDGVFTYCRVELEWVRDVLLLAELRA